MGCAHHGGPALGPVAPLRFTFEVQTTIETTLREPNGQQGPVAYDEPQRRTWQGQLEQAPTRRFRDGSQGDRVQFLDVQASVGDGPLVASDLSGLSTELRSFDNREILSIDLLDPLVGEPRSLDLALALWPALSPRVPELEPGQVVRERSTLPFMLSNGMGMPIFLDLAWTLEGTSACGERSCWHLRCEGPVQGRGLERGPLWHARYRLEGQAMGELWLTTDDASIRRSELSLDLELRTTLSDPSGTTTRAVVVQKHLQRATLDEATP